MDEKLQAFGSAGPDPIWYHGNLNRGQAEAHLADEPDGSYIFRDSSTSPGDFVISISEASRVSHYIIQRTGPESFVLSDKTFRDLPEIVAFYQIHLLDTSVLTVPLPVDDATDSRLAKSYWFKVKAKFNFNARDAEDLSFRKHEVLLIIEKTEAEWWKAQSQTTMMIGQVPSNYLEKIETGPIEIAMKQADEAAAERARMAAAPPPPIPKRKGSKRDKKAEKEEKERQKREQAAFAKEAKARAEAKAREEREAQEREELRQRAELEHQKQMAAERQRLEAERQRKIAEGNAPKRPKFMIAQATMMRQSNTFDKSALTFKVGDLIHVKVQNENGLWEGSVLEGRRKGRKGHFPFTFVELLDSGAFDDDLKALETEFKVQALKEQGVDIEKMLKAGEKLQAPPPVLKPRATAANSGGGAPPALPPARKGGATAPPPSGGRRAPPPLPASSGGRGPPPPLPADGGDEMVYGMGDDDDECIYGSDGEDPLIYGAAEAFDTAAVDMMMDEIYGTM